MSETTVVIRVEGGKNPLFIRNLIADNFVSRGFAVECFQDETGVAECGFEFTPNITDGERLAAWKEEVTPIGKTTPDDSYRRALSGLRLAKGRLNAAIQSVIAHGDKVEVSGNGHDEFPAVKIRLYQKMDL